MWIVAGPNGAGKSTFTNFGIVEKAAGSELIRLNADERTKEIVAQNPDTPAPNLRAAEETDAELASLIEEGVSFLIETVLSSDKYIDDVQRAIQLGYAVGMIYVALAPPEDSVRRVALRVSQGGHDVPIERIVARWYRSLDMLGAFIPYLTALYVFDNTPPGAGGEQPEMIAFKDGKTGKVVITAAGRLPEIDHVLKPFT